MGKPKGVSFQKFLYQILPTSQIFQQDWLTPEIKSTADLKRLKNVFFQKALDSIANFEYPHTELVHKLLFSEGSKSLYKVAAKRELDRETRDFTHEPIENYPSLLVLLDNDPGVQLLLIEKNPKVFQVCNTVAKIFQDNINVFLANHHLQCYVEPQFEESDFWELVRRHEGNIEIVDFELISPNLPNISGGLTVDLREINKVTNSAKTNIRFESPDDSALTIKREDHFTEGLVSYASQGGGNISIKVKNIKKRLTTKTTIKEVSISEAEISGENPGQILDALKGLFK